MEIKESGVEHHISDQKIYETLKTTMEQMRKLQQKIIQLENRIHFLELTEDMKKTVGEPPERNTDGS